MSSHGGRRGHTDASCRRVFCAEHKQGCSSGLTHPHIHMATFSVNAFTKELESIISVKLMNLGHFSCDLLFSLFRPELNFLLFFILY